VVVLNASLCFHRQDPQIDGELLKLQTPSLVSKELGGQVNSLGYGKRSEDVTMDNPQPRP
jgi:hypothetical protein